MNPPPKATGLQKSDSENKTGHFKTTYCFKEHLTFSLHEWAAFLKGDKEEEIKFLRDSKRKKQDIVGCSLGNQDNILENYSRN